MNASDQQIIKEGLALRIGPFVDSLRKANMAAEAILLQLEYNISWREILYRDIAKAPPTMGAPSLGDEQKKE
jgi:hypothetical protein